MSKSEPREWSVYIDDEGKLGLPLSLTKPNCVVVEKSAYDALKQKFDEANEHIASLTCQCADLDTYRANLEAELDQTKAEINQLRFELEAQKVLNTHADAFEALARSEDREKYEAELAEQVRANKQMVEEIARLERDNDLLYRAKELYGPAGFRSVSSIMDERDQLKSEMKSAREEISQLKNYCSELIEKIWELRD